MKCVDRQMKFTGALSVVLYILWKNHVMLGLSMFVMSCTIYHWSGDVTHPGSRVLLFDRALDKTSVTEGVMMALLALQTGLIDLPMPQWMGAMCVILFVVVISLVQSMHEIVEPILLTLSASHSRSILRHIRVTAVCLFLLEDRAGGGKYNLWNSASSMERKTLR
jgi:hypothetical protein